MDIHCATSDYVEEATSAKRNPSENRGPGRKFSRCFIRYRSRYKRNASIHSHLRPLLDSFSLKVLFRKSKDYV